MRSSRLPAGGHALHALLDFRGGREQPPAVVEQQAARRREPRAMPAAVEQQHVEVVLELAHRIGDGRGHVVEFDRGAGEAAAPVDGVEHRQRFEASEGIFKIIE